jgi:hypothetical protein
MMRIVFILIGLIPLKSLGQDGITDSLLFSLTLQSFENLRMTNLKVFHSVTEPRYLLANPQTTLKDIGYFSETDIALLNNQFSNPKIVSWDNSLFKAEGITVVNEPKNEECIFISHPLISEDESIVLIYHEAWRNKKRDVWGSGTLTVWTRTSFNEWIQRRQQVIWTNSIDGK